MRVLCVAAVVMLCTPAGGSAQICAGRASFDYRPLQFRAAGAFAEGQRETAVAVAHGVDRLFVQADAAYDPRSRVSRHAFSAAVGTDQPLTLNNRVHFCPLVTLAYGWTPQPQRNRERVDLLAEVRIGWLSANTNAVAVIPTASLGYRRRYTPGSVLIDPGGNALTSSAGIGVVLRNGVAFRPAVSIPLSGRPREWGVAIEVSLNLPRE